MSPRFGNTRATSTKQRSRATKRLVLIYDLAFLGLCIINYIILSLILTPLQTYACASILSICYASWWDKFIIERKIKNARTSA